MLLTYAHSHRGSAYIGIRGHPLKTSDQKLTFMDPPSPLSNFLHFEDSLIHRRPDRIVRKCPKRKIFCASDVYARYDPDVRGRGVVEAKYLAFRSQIRT